MEPTHYHKKFRSQVREKCYYDAEFQHNNILESEHLKVLNPTQTYDSSPQLDEQSSNVFWGISDNVGTGESRSRQQLDGETNNVFLASDHVGPGGSLPCPKQNDQNEHSMVAGITHPFDFSLNAQGDVMHYNTDRDPSCRDVWSSYRAVQSSIYPSGSENDFTTDRLKMTSCSGGDGFDQTLVTGNVEDTEYEFTNWITDYTNQEKQGLTIHTSTVATHAHTSSPCFTPAIVHDTTVSTHVAGATTQTTELFMCENEFSSHETDVGFPKTHLNAGDKDVDAETINVSKSTNEDETRCSEEGRYLDHTWSIVGNTPSSLILRKRSSINSQSSRDVVTQSASRNKSYSTACDVNIYLNDPEVSDAIKTGLGSGEDTIDDSARGGKDDMHSKALLNWAHWRGNKQDQPLPPCKVCGGKGMGFHYGVNTCMACKGFFRRSLTRKEPYGCHGHSPCVISHTVRHKCPACRLNKCQQVGMSVQGIKTGRYTLQKRKQNASEMKRLALLHSQICMKVEEDRNQIQIEETISSMMKAKLQLEQESLTDPILVKLLKDFKDLRVSNFGQDRRDMWPDGLLSNNWHKDIRQGLESLNVVPGDVHVHVPPTETELKYQDVSGIMTIWMKVMSSRIKKMIQFMKAVPGFSNLSTGDQIILFKDNMFERLVAGYHHHIDADDRSVVTPFGVAFAMDKLFGANMAATLAATAAKIQKLQLTSEERGLLMAFVTITPDSLDLADPWAVTLIQTRLLDALLWMLRRNHGNNRFIFPRLVSVLTEMKNLHAYGRGEAINLMVSNAKAIRKETNVPGLFWEVFDQYRK